MFTIITAGPDDWRLVRDVRLRALEDSPDAFGVTLADARAQPEEIWLQRLAGPNPTFLAVRDGHGLGMGGGFLPPEPDVAWIWGMWTEPAARGLGVGRQILEAVVTWADAVGRTPRLHVAEGNEPARAVYVAAGFAPTGEWHPLREGSTQRIEEMVLRRG